MRIGIDLGGTKIEGIVMNHEGDVLERIRKPTPKGDYEGIISRIAAIVRELETRVDGRHTIGVGTPGAVSPATGLLKNSNSTALNGRPLREDLQKTLGRPIEFTNDANCFALSEALGGSGDGKEVVFGVIIGTGTGAGVVVRGKVLSGPNAIAGEWGHNPLPWPRPDELPGPVCYCGRRGCLETYLSGPGMASDHLRISGEGQEEKNGTTKKPEPGDILRMAQQGDERSEDTLRRYEDRLARGLAHVINILDPDVIVLGGGLSNIDRLYKNVPKLWGEYVFSDTVETLLLPPRFGDSGGVRGAALLPSLEKKGGTRKNHLEG